MITGFCDEYPHILKKHRELFVGAVVIGIYICALPTTTYVSTQYKTRLGFVVTKLRLDSIIHPSVHDVIFSFVM